MGSHKVETGNEDQTANEPPLRCMGADAEASGVQTNKLVMAFNLNRPPTEVPRRIGSLQRSRKEQSVMWHDLEQLAGCVQEW